MFTLPLQASAAGEVAVTIGDYGVLPAFADQDGTQIAGSGAPSSVFSLPFKESAGAGNRRAHPTESLGSSTYGCAAPIKRR